MGRASLFKSITEDEVKEAISIIDGLFARKYANALLCHLETTPKTYYFLWEKLNYCTLSFLQEIANCVKDSSIVEDILVWNASQPLAFDNDYQPISVEVRLRRGPKKTIDDSGTCNDFDGSHANGLDADPRYLPRAVIDKKYFQEIADKTLRQSIISSINAIYVGDDPESYRLKIDTIQYLHDREMDIHCIMIKQPPTFRYNFLNALKDMYKLVLDEIRFEGLPDKKLGMMVGTCMILQFRGCQSGGVIRTSIRKRSRGSNPY